MKYIFWMAMSLTVILSTPAKAEFRYQKNCRNYDANGTPELNPKFGNRPQRVKDYDCSEISLMLEIVNKSEESRMLLEKIANAISENTKATSVLTNKIDASIEANNAAFKNQLAQNLFARIDAIPAELAKNDQAYGAIKARLMEDVAMIFGLEPKTQQ